MAFNKTQVIKHTFGSGWATDFSPSVDGTPDGGGHVVIPYLLDAIDCLFELDGGPHEIGGASKVNTVATTGTTTINGVFDYWRQGTGGTPTRRRVLHTSTVCQADADDGVFASIFTGLTAAAVPCYCTFDDLLIISSDAIADVPKSWDQSTAQNLAGTPPRFSFCATHKNRVWAAGDYANPSRLYYSANVDPEDWIGATSGSIDIDPNDGDMITGLVSHKDVLFVFKGPNKGAIHVITGSSPTGSDAFARKNYARGLGACWHNAIFPYGNDIGFVSQFGTVHSLDATQNFGDFIEASLSRPINTWLRDHVNYARLRYISTAQDVLRGIVYITMSIDSSATNNDTLVMDFRNKDNIRWSQIASYKYGGIAPFVDTNGLRRVLAGGNDGFVRRINMTQRLIDSATALSFKVTTPFMAYGNNLLTKTINNVGVSIYPWSESSFTFGWTRDGSDRQSDSISQGGGVVANIYLDRYAELMEGGEFKAIQYDFRQAIAGEDIEIHSFSTTISPGATSTENASYAYLVDGARFDGTNDYMVRSSDLAGNVDGRLGIFSVWLRLDAAPVGGKYVIFDGEQEHFSVYLESDGRFTVFGSDPVASNRLAITSSNVYSTGTTWIHLLASWNLTIAGSGRLYISDVSDYIEVHYTNLDIDYTQTKWNVGVLNALSGANIFNGGMAELYFATGQYLDFSLAANRRKFITATGKPVNLGVDGSRPTGVVPIVYLRVADGAAASTFANNLGSGGNFTITGALDTTSTSPSD